MKLWLFLRILALSVCALVGQTIIAGTQQSTPVPGSPVEKWLGSGHGDAQSPAFTYWNAEAAIPPVCAACHSGAGSRDFMGFDGSARGEVSQPVAPGGVIDCETCHHDGVAAIDSVRFPSGVEIARPGASVTCMTCHQGRQSGSGIARATAGMEDDVVNAELTFMNPHHALAAATLLGSEVKGAYEYPDKAYGGRFAHVPQFAQCSDCHDPHSLQVAVQACAGCHQTEDLRAIRTSAVDFDGDGDVKTGIQLEIANLSAELMALIESYAAEVSKTPLTYADRFPYFFTAGGEPTPANQYKAWTPRLLRAAYNFQFVAKDKGAYAHNSRYAVQVLYDSMESLAEPMGRTISATRP